MFSRSAPLAVGLIGTWKLVSRTDRTASGREMIEGSLGSDPIAVLYYDRNGNFAAQFMKRDRTELPSESSAAAPNNSRARGGYDAYFGTYTVDDESGTVTQRLLGALSVENVGQTVTRQMMVAGDALTITVETATPQGEPVTRTLSWTRIARGPWIERERAAGNDGRSAVTLLRENVTCVVPPPLLSLHSPP